jgi:hypothetical protein
VRQRLPPRRYFIDGASFAASGFVQTFVDAFTLTEYPLPAM